MHARHRWKPEQRGCRENPGVWSQGHQMIFHDVCSCGAFRETRTSVIPGNRGRLIQITQRSGDTETRDTREWRYS